MDVESIRSESYPQETNVNMGVTSYLPKDSRSYLAWNRDHGFGFVRWRSSDSEFILRCSESFLHFYPEDAHICIERWMDQNGIWHEMNDAGDTT